MATDTAQSVVICAVCGEEAVANMTAECNWCGNVYHLNQRNDVEAKDCGQVWIDEQYLTLQFACDTCLSGGAPEPPRQDPTSAKDQPRRYKRRA